MKTYFKRSLVAVIVASIFSSGAFAEEIGNTTGEVEVMDTLSHSVDTQHLKNQYLQLQVDYKKMSEELNSDKFEEALRAELSKYTKQFTERESAYKNQIASLTELVSKMKQKMEEDEKNRSLMTSNSEKIEYRLFVTDVFGIGRNLKSNIYFDNKVIEVREGLALNEDVSVKKIHNNGVTFTFDGEDVFIALTNEDYAFSQTFNRDTIDRMNASQPNQRR
jgi:hypothetical protein